VSGEQSERGSVFGALAHYGKKQVSEVASLLLSQGTISIRRLLAKPLGDYVELDESILRASAESGDYVVSLFKSGWSEGPTKSTLLQIEKHGLGGLLREPLVEMIRSFRAGDGSQPIKQQICVYKALRGQRFRGVIMLLDSSRGIGSIWCDEMQHFYFLHQSEVWDSAPLTIYDAVEFEVATGRKPKKDFEAIKVSQCAQSENRGTIEEVIGERRFGYILTDVHKSLVFFHFENVAEADMSRLAPGVRVGFVVVPRLKKTQSSQAVRVRVM
jgi:cold shock CspA family protein